jgi:hypothetical protein
MPTIRLATLEDMRAITTKNLQDIERLPFLYIPTDDPEVMRVWGVANEDSVREAAKNFPGTLVAAVYVGERADRGDLIYNGAEPATDFLT